ncbi:MAG: ion channel [Bacteroidia bacterium]|nr:ion channel [Bacteroidia bacterium]
MLKSLFQVFETEELGFGQTASQQGNRILMRNGQFNIARIGSTSIYTFSNAYHWLITSSWATFTFIIFGFYFLINLIFAWAYYCIGVEYLNINEKDPFHQFLEAFFFSTQTITTVGYGRINPQGIATNLVASLEAVIGLLGSALATGLLFARFSHPNAKLKYSDVAIIAPYKNSKALMFRFLNARHNHLVECEVKVILSILQQENDKNVRKFINLKLELSKVNFLAMSWTVVHEINETSPLWGLSESDLKNLEAEVLVLFQATDDTYAQVVHSRYSYTWNEIVWNAKFKPMVGNAPDGRVAVFESELSEYIKL